MTLVMSSIDEVTLRASARVGILIQARMSSRRLPGKVLRPLAGRPVLAYVTERCQRAEGAALVAVITSVESSDDAIAEWAEATGTRVFRGPLDDVAGRFVQAAAAFGLDAFVRTNADSPLIDPRLIERGIALWRASDADLVTSIMPRTLPIGMSVEVLDARRYAEAYGEMTAADEREHVTTVHYRHPERFRIASFGTDRDLGGRSLAVDTGEDLARIERIVLAMKRPHWEYDWQGICELADGIGELALRTEPPRW